MDDFTCVSSNYQPYNLNIKGIFDSAMASDAGNHIVYKDRRLTYQDFGKRVHQLAGALSRLGVQKGDTVAFLDYDSNRFLEAYFSVPMYGATLLMVNFRLSLEHLIHVFKTSRASIFFVHQDFYELYLAIKYQLPDLKQVVLLGEGNSGLSDDDFDDPFYETLLKAESDDFAFEDLPEETVATTFFTTGTTGKPKGVYYTHRQLALHTMGIMAHAGTAPYNGSISRRDVYMPMTPMFHVHAWGMPYVMTAMGCKQVYPGRYAAETFLKLIREEGITLTHGVPTLAHMILNHPDAKKTDFSQLKMIIGGAVTTYTLGKQAAESGVDMYSLWGMSETCPWMIASFLRHSPAGQDDIIQKKIATGYPAPFCKIRVVNANMEPLPHDGQSQGELLVRGPWLTPGYLGDQDASDNLWHEGWLRTGDIAVIHPDGMVQIMDRLKDVIKTGGEWVSSLSVENTLSKHEAVAEVAVIARQDPKWGERPVAYVVLKDDADATEEELKKLVKDQIRAGKLEPYSGPDEIFFVDHLPRTSVGKLNKKAMRDQLSGLANG